MTPEQEKEIGDKIYSMMEAGISGDDTGAACILEELGGSLSPQEMYGVCCGVASAGKHFIETLYGAVADIDEGDMWCLQKEHSGDTQSDPAEDFAARFLITVANDDQDMALALYAAMLKGGGVQYVDSVCALVAATVSLGRTVSTKNKKKGVYRRGNDF